MHIISVINEFYRDLKAQKLRTFLTIFGIVWGTVALVVLLAFGNGFQRQTMKTMNGIGEGILIVFPGHTAKPFKGFNRDRWIRFREEDSELLRTEISQIGLISPEYSTWNTSLRVKTNVRNPNITGIVPEYADIRYIYPQPGGRFINDLDIELKRRVVFLGNDLAEYLYSGKDPVGKYVYVGNTPFLVIGVLKHKEQDSSYNSRDKDRAFIPASTFSSFFGHKYINNIVIKPVSPLYSLGIRDGIYRALGKKYKFDPTDTEALGIWDTSEFQKMIFYMFIGINAFMAIIGFFTLTVGGIGVANIMYVVVQERTREIGIRRSIGAKKKHIMSQFYLEAFFIIFVGACLGAIVSGLIIYMASFLPIDEFVGSPAISPWISILVIGALGAIGFIAGYFPARKAANLKVVDCLRF